MYLYIRDPDPGGGGEIAGRWFLSYLFWHLLGFLFKINLCSFHLRDDHF
jgi:hypothetical protein